MNSNKQYVITKSAEIELLNKRFGIYYNFMLNYYNPTLQKISIWGLNETKKLINEYVEKKQIGNLRQLTKELNSDMREELPRQKSQELRNLFHKYLGEDIETNEKKHINKIEAIKKRGKIKTESEYRLIENRINEIIIEDKKLLEVQKLDALLGTF